jgi:hypothetical protein
MLCKIWGFHGSDYEECRLLGYKNPVRTSQETHYFSTTESSRLMLCKIWCFHGSGYEECRLLGYKNPVRTSQETHYFSTTELSQLMLCKIWGFSRWWLWRMSSSGMLRRMTGQVTWDLWYSAALEQVFSEYIGFPCHSFVPLVFPQSLLSIVQGWYTGTIKVHSNSGLGSTSQYKGTEGMLPAHLKCKFRIPLFVIEM